MPNSRLRCWFLVFSAALVLAAKPTCGQTDYDPPPVVPHWQAIDQPEMGPQFPTEPAPIRRATMPERVPRPALPLVPPTTARPPRETAPRSAELPKQVQNVVDFYGGRTSQRALAQLPARPSSGAARPVVPTQVRKPYEGAVDSPTLSPYLNLFREDHNQYLPNYHAFVRPAQVQQTRNLQQRRELLNLRQQTQAMAVPPPVGNPGGLARPTAGYGTRFMNTGQFYRTGSAVR